ncbi:hypothetical protein A3762_01305 [Oleiphilus sp. HI0125]|nr:hypothetical protein A3762_01305 [Oleiphilus sp. HI0125]
MTHLKRSNTLRFLYLSVLSAMHQIQEHIHQLQQQHFRACIAIKGTADWVKESYQVLAKKLPDGQSAILLGHDASLLRSEHDRCIAPKHYREILGQQSQILIWDLRKEIHPDAIAASSGVLEGGGLLFLLIDDTDNQLQASHSRFLNTLIESEAMLVIDSDNFDEALAQFYPFQVQSSNKQGITLNEEQQACLAKIERVVKGHRNRPLILRADRGRGKSTTLGIAAAQLLNNAKLENIILVADHPNSVATLIQHFEQNIDHASLRDKLRVIPSDVLLETLPETHLLIIDEAASFPLPTLHSLIEHYARIVMASTLHGYEGSGRGFDLKLNTIFKAEHKQASFYSLDQPIRWASGDPLERVINESFVLQAHLTEVDTTKPQARHFEWINKKELLEDQSLLEQVFALLVLAHYQSRPSDLSQLIDNEDIRIGVMFEGEHIVGVLASVEEDLSAQDAQLKQDIINGKRRLKGHLSLQAFASFYSQAEWLDLKCQRILRIVVHPARQSSQIGSELIQELLASAKVQNLDACSVSYGLEAKLFNFWARADFESTRLSYQADASSGLPSMMMLNPISSKAKTLLSSSKQRFIDHFVIGLPIYFQKLSPALVNTILLDVGRSLNVGEALSEQQIARLNKFSAGQTSLWDSWPDIRALTLYCATKRVINTEQANVLIAVMLQNYAMEIFKVDGKKLSKKEWLAYLREASKTLLAELTI